MQTDINAKETKINVATPTPAFPFVVDRDRCPAVLETGMSLRDYFAAAAMQGILAANAKMPIGINEANIDEIVAQEAYASADAMLKARDDV